MHKRVRWPVYGEFENFLPSAPPRLRVKQTQPPLPRHENEGGAFQVRPYWYLQILSPRRRQEHEGVLCVLCVLAVMSSWVSSRQHLSFPILKRGHVQFSAHSTLSFCGIPRFTVLFLSLFAFIRVHSRLTQILTLVC